MVTWSSRNTVIAAVLLSALVGGVTGFSAGYLSRAGPTAQTRDFYLFGVDQSFNSTLASGLGGDYAFSSSVINVNRGDILEFPFYIQTNEIITLPIVSLIEKKLLLVDPQLNPVRFITQPLPKVPTM